MTATHILAIDQGTTSSRAVLFDGDMKVIATEAREFAQHFPRSGWVEHDPRDLLDSTLATCTAVIEKSGLAATDIAAIGITNQRETTLVWDVDTGETLGRAIVWQDRRTAAMCAHLRDAGHSEVVSAQTGLLLDPYFSATKLKWILDENEGARDRARAGKLKFGTVDSWLIWNLTGGRAHVTDATNAARTMLYDIHTGRWSADICELLDIPHEMLPEVKDCAADFGTTYPAHFGAGIPILGVAGDQQAATIGQACFKPGMVKSTYGTGCFALLNTGTAAVTSQNRLLTTVAYQLDGQTTYALEGSIFIAGAVVQWLRDGLGIIKDAGETAALANSADEAQNVILVPAFVGLGAPYWNPDCRGAIYGLTRASGPAELARAALESVGFQTRDLLEAMQADWQTEDVAPTLRVDGGMAASDWTLQFLSDIIGAPVDRPHLTETTALGAAWLAGYRAGVYPDADGFAAEWALERTFTPKMDSDTANTRYDAWQRAVQATLTV
ncbi:glycerol kinase GlpK [Sulfitobacter sp. F26169L]|uniref:glycerol kinase GlpK n=1 Tax=Sulfitobacter sp. F26169L TaxID=2996015 RepID=UPI002260B52B|nr:glycerol kinase GlpK [Sulfitobacter sp. F26169L]MCX7568143.1 glycerol kinase GlpK [Sulfitobacter sp. F26169L]